MQWTIHRLRARQKDAGRRLDLFLAEADLDLSRSMTKKIIDLGGVHINGRRVRNCSLSVRPDDWVEVYLDHLPLEPYRLSSSDILYQDKYLLVLNKPAQIETQPTHARYKGTLYEALQWHLRDPFRPRATAEIGMIQRLDRGTSGLMVFSIHPRAHKEMTRIFLDHQVDKRYLALTQGSPDPPGGEIRSFLARVRKDNRVRSVSHGGKEAVTRYRVLENFPGAALVELELLTGRSHQIRAHMAEKNSPLLGDVRYGGRQEIAGMCLTRPMLHAFYLAFKHPVENIPLDFTLPLPRDMQTLTTVLSC